MGGSSSMVSGGAWKRLGPRNWKGEARSENTGSVSQNLPSSLSSMVECPRRHRLRSGAASRSACVSGLTSMGLAGTVLAGLSVAKRQKMATVLKKPGAWRGATLRNLPSTYWGDCSYEAEGRLAQERML